LGLMPVSSTTLLRYPGATTATDIISHPKPAETHLHVLAVVTAIQSKTVNPPSCDVVTAWRVRQVIQLTI
jgi:hypothetical protein